MKTGIFIHFAPLGSKSKVQLEHIQFNVHLPKLNYSADITSPERLCFLPQGRFIYFYDSTKFTTSFSRTICTYFRILRKLVLGFEHGKLSQSAVNFIPRVSACLPTGRPQRWPLGMCCECGLPEPCECHLFRLHNVRSGTIFNAGFAAQIESFSERRLSFLS